MDLLRGDIKKIYFHYLAAAFGSALISSIYSLVDTAMVGQYRGPEGAAALAVVAPVWNLIYSLGLLTGIGGAVLYGSAKGRQNKKYAEENEYFTAALLSTVVLALLSWFGIAFFDKPLLQLFGADEVLLPLARQYLYPVKFGVPIFLLNQMLAAFLRNDNNPGLATAAVLAGGIFNVFGDYFFIFHAGLDIMGAGLATVIGAFITFLVMLTHFRSQKNTLRLVRPHNIFRMTKNIMITGFATFFIDAAMGILTMFFNRQIMKYSGADALAVYGVIVNISTIVQCCAYSTGQAAQPIISMNYGAGGWHRVRETLKYALMSVGFFSFLWTGLILAFPNYFIHIFMKPTGTVLTIAPFIMRTYGISFLLLPFNIFSTYYFQSIMKPGVSFMVSVIRGALLSGFLIYILPVAAGIDAIWMAMPVTEVMVGAGAAGGMLYFTRTQKTITI